MKLEQQVTSLEISQRIKELGVKQEGMFSWYQYTTRDDSNGIKDTFKLMFGRAHKNTSEISAFTVAELGEMLPTDQHSNSFKTKNGDWVMYYAPEGGEVGYTKVYGGTEADARGKMLIYLLENKLITL